MQPISELIHQLLGQLTYFNSTEKSHEAGVVCGSAAHRIDVTDEERCYWLRVVAFKYVLFK